MSKPNILSFDKTMAAKYGVNAAVIYRNFCYWCDLNRANNRNHHDGNWWTYNSLEALQEIFEFMTVGAIRTALKKLIDAGLVSKGCFNENPYDKTAWYSICDFKQIDNEEIPQGRAANDKCTSVKNSKCTSVKNSTSSLPNITTDITTDITTNIKDVRTSVPTCKSVKPTNPPVDFSVFKMTPEQIEDVKRIRKANKGGKITQRVADSLAKEFSKAWEMGWSSDELLTEWECRGWKAFKAEWIKPKRTVAMHDSRTQSNIASLQNMSFDDA